MLKKYLLKWVRFSKQLIQLSKYLPQVSLACKRKYQIIFIAHVFSHAHIAYKSSFLLLTHPSATQKENVEAIIIQTFPNHLYRPGTKSTQMILGFTITSFQESWWNTTIPSTMEYWNYRNNVALRYKQEPSAQHRPIFTIQFFTLQIR